MCGANNGCATWRGRAKGEGVAWRGKEWQRVEIHKFKRGRNEMVK